MLLCVFLTILLCGFSFFLLAFSQFLSLTSASHLQLRFAQLWTRLEQWNFACCLYDLLSKFCQKDFIIKQFSFDLWWYKEILYHYLRIYYRIKLIKNVKNKITQIPFDKIKVMCLSINFNNKNRWLFDRFGTNLLSLFVFGGHFGLFPWQWVVKIA